MKDDKVLVIESWTKQPNGTIAHDIVNKDELFAKYAEEHGFWIAIRDLKIDRSEWNRLQKLMQESDL